MTGAGSGNQTRIACLEGRNNNLYTIPAWHVRTVKRPPYFTTLSGKWLDLAEVIYCSVPITGNLASTLVPCGD